MRPRGVGLLAAVALLPLAQCGTKDANTLVFASFGDWGWSTTGGQNVLLTGSAVLSATCANYTVAKYQANPAAYASCLDGDKLQQGTLISAGLQQVSQIAVANAMAAQCTASGSCDFIIVRAAPRRVPACVSVCVSADASAAARVRVCYMYDQQNTGDNFYDLGIVDGTSDSQWTTAFQNVYTKALFGNIPFLSTLGNHDYSILSPNAASSQIAYSAVDPRWVLPDHQYARTFTSASGAVSIQVVEIDSTPLNDRYLFSGGSGGGFATGASGVDTRVNSPTTNAVINSGVTAANGWTAANGYTGNLFNASNFACGNCVPGASAAECGYDLITGAPLKPYGNAKVPSGCKYASAELAPFAHPAARNATWANVTATLQAAYGKVQYQTMFSHFPILSAQQRMTPYADSATAMFATLGAAAPQVYFNGHDHIMAQMSRRVSA